MVRKNKKEKAEGLKIFDKTPCQVSCLLVMLNTHCFILAKLGGKHETHYYSDHCRGHGARQRQRRYLTSVAGELPPDQCLPEIWLRHDEHLAAAGALLEDLERVPQREWTCAACGERIEGGLEEYWACGAAMPA